MPSTPSPVSLAQWECCESGLSSVHPLFLSAANLEMLSRGKKKKKAKAHLIIGVSFSPGLLLKSYLTWVPSEVVKLLFHAFHCYHLARGLLWYKHFWNNCKYSFPNILWKNTQENPYFTLQYNFVIPMNIVFKNQILSWCFNLEFYFGRKSWHQVNSNGSPQCINQCYKIYIRIW